MSMSGSAFYTYVLRKFKRTDKSTEVYDAITDTIANMRTKFAFDDYKEEAYVTGISTLGGFQIALPSDFKHIIGTISIVDTDTDQYYDPLVQISKQKYDELYPDRLLSTVASMNKDVPRHFCIYAAQLYVGPVPDKITYQYQINYATEETSAVTSSTTAVPFTNDYMQRTVLRSGTLYELNEGLENFEEAAYWKAVYLDGLETLIKMEKENLADSGRVEYHGV